MPQKRERPRPSATEEGRTVRLLADFDRFWRRTNEEKALEQASGKRVVLLALLPLIEPVPRTSTSMTASPQRFSGSMNGLRSARAEPFDSVGGQFDPTIY